MRKIVLSVWIFVMLSATGFITFDYYINSHLLAKKSAVYETVTEAAPAEEITAPPPSPPEENPMTMNVKTPIASFDLTAYNSMGWAFVAKLLTLILVTYGGIRFINKKMDYT